MVTQREIKQAAVDDARATVAANRLERVLVVRLMPETAGRGCSASAAWVVVQEKLNASTARLKAAEIDLAAEIAADP